MHSSENGISLPENLPPAHDRAAGAVMGVLIGDAMAVGPHWFYDLDEMRRAYGGRITDHVPVLPDRYHVGVELGDVSQSGQFNQLLIESIVDCDGYVESDYTSRLDALLDTLDGTESGGRFTEQAVRDIWYSRKQQGKAWRSEGFASFAETSGAAQRAVVIAARYPDSFEDAMLTAINSGGNNLARGTLTGALSGAQTGLSGIPERFITGFKNHRKWVDLAIEIAHRGTQGLS